MSTEIKKEIQLEIAHVLFIDIVGYSKLSINDQHAAVEELNQIVRASEQFQRAEAANRLLKIPTGDGMALVFYTSPEAPAQCAVKHGVRVTIVSLYDDQFGNATLPRTLETIQKRRKRLRWATMTAALLALAMIAAGIAMFSGYRVRSTLAAPEKSIAVLPFENLSEEKANAFFADGVQDEILTNLAKIADLKVISRTSVMQYKTGVARNLREIGQALGVAHLLEGSVQRAGGKVRVNAQLIDARTDAHLWAQTYDRDLADVFAIQSEIAKTIADQLQAKLSPSEK